MTEDREAFEIALDNFRLCLDTWIQQEQEGYKLYLNSDLNSGPSDEYILVEYSLSDEETVFDWGHTTIVPTTFEKSELDDELTNRNLPSLSDGQFLTVKKAYSDLTLRVLEDAIFEGVPQLYKKTLFYELEDMQSGMAEFVDRVHEKIDSYEEYKDETDKNWYNEFKEHEKLDSSQYESLGKVITSIAEWENEEKVPYAQHCQIKATLEVDTYESWEIRAIEHLHNSILANKPELAKTKALLEAGLNQTEIVNKLNKSPSTVSRQVAAINEWEDRAAWSMRQT